MTESCFDLRVYVDRRICELADNIMLAVEDISQGRENVKVPVVNELDGGKPTPFVVTLNHKRLHPFSVAPPELWIGRDRV